MKTMYAIAAALMLPLAAVAQQPAPTTDGGAPGTNAQGQQNPGSTGAGAGTDADVQSTGSGINTDANSNTNPNTGADSQTGDSGVNADVNAGTGSDTTVIATDDQPGRDRFTKDVSDLKRDAETARATATSDENRMKIEDLSRRIDALETRGASFSKSTSKEYKNELKKLRKELKAARKGHKRMPGADSTDSPQKNLK